MLATLRASDIWKPLLTGASRKLGVLSLKPFDTATESGRAKERNRRIALTALANMLARGVSIGGMMVSVPLTLHYLGQERFGMWMVITSFALLLSFSDLGLGNGVLNALAKAHGEGDRLAQRAIISNGFAALTLIAAMLAVAAFALFPFIDWARVFNVSSPAAVAEAEPAVWVYAAIFVIGAPLTLVQRIQAGLQQGFASSLWQCVSSLLSLVCVLLVIAGNGGLPLLVAAFAGAPQVANLCNMATLFLQEPDLRPTLRLVRLAGVRRLAETGMLFLVLQLAVAVSSGADNLIIGRSLGARAVATYVVPERMFSIITHVMGMALSPLWPAYGEAKARGDLAWVRRTLRLSLVCGAIVSVSISVSLVTFGDLLIRLWVGDGLQPDGSLLAALGAWKVIEVIGTTMAMFLNGLGLLRQQLLMVSAVATISIGAKTYFASSHGLAVIPGIMCLCYVMLMLPFWLMILHALKKGVLLKNAGENFLFQRSVAPDT